MSAEMTGPEANAYAAYLAAHEPWAVARNRRDLCVARIMSLDRKLQVERNHYIASSRECERLAPAMMAAREEFLRAESKAKVWP